MLRASTSATIMANAKAAVRNNWALTSGSPAGFACRSRTRTRRNLRATRTIEDLLVADVFLVVARRRFSTPTFFENDLTNPPVLHPASFFKGGNWRIYWSETLRYSLIVWRVIAR